MLDQLTPLDRRERVRVSKRGGIERKARLVEDRVAERRQRLYRVTGLMWLAAGILESLIGIRVVLRLIAANPSNPFARAVYSFTDLFLWPFRGLTATPSFDRMVLEVPSIIAMVVYTLAAYATVRLVWLVFYRSHARALTVYEREED